MKKILVTGGAGFIGSNLCEALLDRGHFVRCLDNFATGKKENITLLLKNNNFQLLEGDIRNSATCNAACEDIEVVFHQAALGSVPRSLSDPVTSHEVNVGGFVNILKAASDQGVERFIYASSSSVYGDSDVLPKAEDKIGKPLSPYAVTKWVNEIYTDVFQRIYGMNIIGLRYFNVFGRKQDPNGPYAAVIPKFILQLMNYESPVINGDGTYSRDFTYIDNVIQMNLLAMDTLNPDALNQIYNTAAGERTSIRDMAEMIRKILSKYDPKISDVKIKYGPDRQGDVPHSWASMEKAAKYLGYQPTHNFEEGLRETIAWYWQKLKLS